MAPGETSMVEDTLQGTLGETIQREIGGGGNQETLSFMRSRAPSPETLHRYLVKEVLSILQRRH